MRVRRSFTSSNNLCYTPFNTFTVILFDVKYDTNDLEEEDENDGSDAKNSETFFESSITPGGAAIANKSTSSKNGENNNNYKFNNKNGNMSSCLPDEECDLIQRALYMTLNDESPKPAKESIKEQLLKCKLIIKCCSPLALTILCCFLARESEDFLPIPQEMTTRILPNGTIANIPILKCNICPYTHTDAKQLRGHYKSIHKIYMPEDDIIGLNKSGFPIHHSLFLQNMYNLILLCRSKLQVPTLQ